MQTTPTIFRNYYKLLTNSLLLFVLITLIFKTPVKGQGQTCKEELFPLQDESRKSGYVNAFGEWKVRPFYTKAFPFRGKVAIVLSGTQYGVINCEGNIVFKPQFQKIKEYSGGVTWAKKDNKWGLVTDTGSVLSDFKYTEINEVGSYTYVTWVLNDFKWQLLDNFTGSPINPDFYDEVKVLNFQTSLVKKEMLIGLLENETGEYIIQPEYQKVFKIAPNVFTAIKDQQWFLFSDEGKQLTKSHYDSISVFGKFRFLVKKDNKYGVLDYRGNTITPIKFKSIRALSDMHFVAEKDGQYAYFNIYGNKVKEGLVYAESFHDGVALAKDSVFKILNLFTKEVHTLSEYDTVYRQSNTNNFIGETEDATYLLNTKGEKTIPSAYGAIHLNNTSDWIYLTNNQGCHYYNTKTRHLTPYYKHCSPYKAEYATAKKEDEWIIVDQEGKELSTKFKAEPVFLNLNDRVYAAINTEDEIGLFDLRRKHFITEVDGTQVYACGDFFSVKEKGEYKLINQDGEEVLKPKYDTIITTSVYEWPKIVSEKGEYNLMSKEGDDLHKKGFSTLQYFKEQLFIFSVDENYGVITTKGKVLIPSEYNKIGDYSEYYLSAQKEGKWGYINLKNETRIPFTYLEANPFKNQVAVVKLDDASYQVVDKRGTVLEKGFTNFLINEDGERELSNSEFILKLKDGKLVKSYNYIK